MDATKARDRMNAVSLKVKSFFENKSSRDFQKIPSFSVLASVITTVPNWYSYFCVFFFLKELGTKNNTKSTKKKLGEFFARLFFSDY